MSESLFSPHWYRIAELHPRLRPQVSVRRQVSRGQSWYVLHAPAAKRFHRVNELAYELVGRLDGRRSVNDLWLALIELLGDRAPSQPEVIRILGQLTEAGLLQAEVTPDVRQIEAQRQERRSRERRGRLNPFAFRIGLFDPSALLHRLQPLAQALFNPLAFWCWLAWAVLGAAVAASHAGGIVDALRTDVGTPHNLLLMWLCYPLMKALHELGHGLAMRRYGCEVSEVGVNFLVLMPVPYVDASASHHLASRRQRAMVAAAGIMVEVAIAVAALLVWANVEDGLVRDLALVLMVMGGLSTLLFNGNPLLKFDAYYVLCDVLDMPNLAQHSARWGTSRLRRGQLRLLRPGVPLPDDATDGPLPADGFEKAAWLLYSPLSWLYRLVLSSALIFWLGGKSAVIGLAVAGWMMWSLVLRPVWQLVTALDGSPELAPVRGRTRALAAGVAVAAVAVVGWVPWTPTLVTQGVVWPAEQAQVRAAVAGEVMAVLAHDGQPVRAGDALIEMSNPELVMRQRTLLARIQAAESRRTAAWSTDPLAMLNADEDVARDREALAQVEAELAALVLRAGVDGTLALPAAQDLPGRLVDKGERLAHVLQTTAGGQGGTVRAVLDERDVDGIRAGVKHVSVWLDNEPGRVLQARIAREVPAATDQLPSAALGEAAGGNFAIDPRDADGLRTQRPVVVVDLDLPGAGLARVGGRATVRFDLAPQTLYDRLALRTRQLLLRHFAG